MLRVLGIDPGTLTTGWGLISGSPARPALVDCGAIRLASRLPLALRLRRLGGELRQVIDRLRPTCAAVESPFHGAGPRSTLQLAHARGVILFVLAECDIDVDEYTPAQVKKTVTGNGRADKQQVQAMVQRLIGTPMDRARGYDTTDALGVALCHLSLAAYRSAVSRAESNRPRSVPRRPSGARKDVP